MKTLVLTVLLACTTLSAAQAANNAQPTDLERKVLQSLVVHASSIQLEDEYEDLDAEFQLPALIAGYLSGGYASSRNEEYVTLHDVSVQCVAGRRDRWNCDVIFQNGDFKVLENGTRLEGPELESSISFTAPVSLDARGKVEIHGRKFRVSIAG